MDDWWSCSRQWMQQENLKILRSEEWRTRNRLGRLTVPKGHQGSTPPRISWIAAMMSLYREITGKEPVTSVGGPFGDNAGKARGPLIRFLGAAGKPIGIKYSTDGWRSRIRIVQKGTRRSKSRNSIWPFRSSVPCRGLVHVEMATSRASTNKTASPASVALIEIVRLLCAAGRARMHRAAAGSRSPRATSHSFGEAVMTGGTEYLRAAEIARLTGLSIRTVRRWIADEIDPLHQARRRQARG